MFFPCLLVLSTKSLDNMVAAIACLILALSTHGRDFRVGNSTFKSSQPRMQRQDAKIPQCITRSDGKQTSPTLVPYQILLYLLRTQHHTIAISWEWQLILSRNHLQPATTAMFSKGSIFLTEWQLLEDMSCGRNRSHDLVCNTVYPL